MSQHNACYVKSQHGINELEIEDERHTELLLNASSVEIVMGCIPTNEEQSMISSILDSSDANPCGLLCKGAIWADLREEGSGEEGGANESG